MCNIPHDAAKLGLEHSHIDTSMADWTEALPLLGLYLIVQHKAVWQSKGLPSQISFICTKIRLNIAT